MPNLDLPDGLVEAVRSAERITVLTGAGMSAESGLPTFRDAETGLWARYDPMTLATPEAWNDDPGLVWAWYQRRRFQLAAVEPNPGHRAIAALGTRLDVAVVTQNVDDLHERAGTDDVIHLHGSLTGSHCDRCAARYSIPAVDPEAERLSPIGCECGGLIRPSVVWFGEQLPEAEFGRAIDRAESSDLMLVIGTSGLVYPAAGLPELARAQGALIVEINPNESGLSASADIVWRSGASAALTALLGALEQ